MSIEVKELTKFYDNHQALDHVSFKIKQGEIVGFLGPNGAGKSTLMKILTTSLLPSFGHAEINGIGIDKTPIEIQKSIGYLAENNPLYNNMYVSEYLHFIAAIHNLKKEHTAKAIELCSLKTVTHKKINTLSKGYKQRVGLASALIHDPKVLILDEPTTGLDPNQLEEVRNLIRRFKGEKTILLSTHIMQEVEAICDRVIILNKGKIVADESIETIINNENQIIEVEFDYRVEDVFLSKIKYVENVVNTNGFTYEISFSTQQDMRPQIFDFAHDNELKILKLNKRNKTLEQLFRELTN